MHQSSLNNTISVITSGEKNKIKYDNTLTRMKINTMTNAAAVSVGSLDKFSFI